MKKIIKEFWILAILLSVALSGYAYDFSVDGVYYGKNSDGKTVYVTSRSDRYSGSVVIPSTVTYSGTTYTVTSIGADAFENCSGLTSVTIPNSVTEIGGSAFYGCRGLTLVTIPNSVTEIGGYAFYSCRGLTSVTIPNSVTSIGSSAFEYCSGLTSVTIPNSVTEIGGSAFSGCSGLTSVTIPNSVSSIGGSAFSGTAWYNNQPNGLIYAGKVAYGYKGTMPENTSITIKDGTLGIAGGAFSGCSGLTYVTIPYSVTSIGSSAFYNCSGLTSVTIPNSVTSIGESTFYNCSGLTSVTIPNSVTSIGFKAFYGCSGLTSVTIPNSVTKIAEEAFFGTTWYNNQPDGLVYAGKVAYKYKGTMPDNTSITIKDGTTSITISAFKGCSGLTSVTIPNSVTEIGGSAFSGCSGLTSVVFNAENCTSMWLYGSPVFKGCSNLTSLTIGENVKTIPDFAFSLCSGLTSVTIPNSVTEIGGSAFYNCSGLTSVVFNAENCKTMGSSNSLVFKGCSNLTSLTIGEKVKTIPSCAFSGCSGLTYVTIPNSVTSIGVDAFYGTAWYNNQQDGLVYAGKVAYKYKGTMPDNTSITIKDGTLGIAGGAFSNCSGLTSVTIPNSVTSIGDYAFYNCSGLTSVTIPNSVTEIGGSAFSGCSGLTSVTIPNSVTSIGDCAFDSCHNLEMVTFNATISNVPTNNVFSSDKGLSFIVGEAVESIPINIVGNSSGGVSKVIALVDTPPTVTSETFDSSVTPSATLYVKKIVVSKYFIADGWSDFANIKTIDNLVTNISLDNTSMNLTFGETSKLNVTVEPANATLTDVIWTASNSCVSVDQEGNVKGLIEGQCVVTAEAVDGSGVKAECVVTVGNIYAQSISLSQEEVALEVNGMTKLSYTILPNNTTLKDVEWTCSAESVVAFKENSDRTVTVLGLRPGTATLTARTTDGSNLSATCKITVTGDDVDYFTANEFDIYPGASYPLPVEMINQDEIAGFQCDIYLPEGLSIAKVDDTYDIALTDRKDDHVLYTSLQSDGAVRVLSYSMTSKGYNGNSGNLFTINLTASSDYDGLGTIKISNIIVSTPQEVEYKCPDVEVNVGLKQYTLGDVNGDGSISVTDVISATNYILGSPSSNFIYEAADITGDGKIGVGDIISIVNRILSETEATPSVTTLAVDSLEADAVDIEAGETKTVSVNLNNAEVYTGFQFDIKMPNGLKFENAYLSKLANSHKVAFKQREDGTVRVVVFSLTNEDIKQNIGSLLSFDVTADNTFVGGEIEIDNVLFANKATQEYTLYNLPIEVSRNGGVNDMIGHSRVYVENNRIVVTVPESQIVTISSVSGVSSSYEVTAGKNVMPISQSGLYIVKANDLVKKVIIK